MPINLSDNVFPKVDLSEQAEPATPSAGTARLFLDTSDGILKWKGDDGSVYEIGQAPAVPTRTALYTVVTTGSGGVAIPDAAIPRTGAAIWTDGADTGVGVMQWYRSGTYNRVTGVSKAAVNPWVYREASFSASGSFCFYIEGTQTVVKKINRARFY